MKSHLPLFLSIIMLCACQPPADASADRAATSAAAQFICSKADGGLGCLAEACEAAGGTFDQNLKTCSCGKFKTFAITNQVPRCELIKFDNECLRTQSFASLVNNDLELSKCSWFINSKSEGAGALYVDLAQSPAKERLAFAKWADSKFWSDFDYQFWRSPLPSEGDYIAIGQANDLGTEGLLKPFDVPDEGVDYVNFLPSAKVFATAQDAIDYLAKRTRKPSQNVFAGIQPLLAELISAYQSTSLNLNYSIESRYSAGCLRSCVARSEKVISGDHQFWFVKFYNAGALYRSEFVMSGTDGKIIATMILADLSPTVLLQFAHTEHGFLTRVEGYNLKGQRILTKDIGNSSVESRPRLATSADVQIGLCEDSIRTDVFASANLTLLSGPNQQSYFGWSSSPDDFFMGNYSLNAYGIEEVGQRAYHSKLVGEILNVSEFVRSSTGLIPLGLTSCIYPKQIANWWTAFKASGARVINMSVSEEMDRKTCETGLATHPLKSDQNAALWVASAGNTGKNAARGCPQHLVGQPDLIIVGANTGDDRMHPKSNYGESLVDIAAPGESVSRNEWGTSFSSPRVARVAAEIFKFYPKLSPLQVKQAILLGARIPDQPLPVLSKGILDSKSSMKIARALSNNVSVERILPNLFCESWETSCDLAETKAQINSKITRKAQ